MFKMEPEHENISLSDELMRQASALAKEIGQVFDAAITPMTMPVRASNPDMASLILDVPGIGPLHFRAQYVADGSVGSVREAALQLALAVKGKSGLIPVLLAPYFTQPARHVCKELGIHYFDEYGNVDLRAPGVVLQLQGEKRPPSRQRPKEISFSPKVSQVLLTMLQNPERYWRVAELQVAANVSLGMVSRTRTLLLEYGWANVDADGIRIAEPRALLERWIAEYKQPGSEQGYFLGLRPRDFASRMKGLATTDVMCSSFTAADYHAPLVRQPNTYLMAHRDAVEKVVGQLELQPVQSGANLFLRVVKDANWFRNKVVLGNGVPVSSVPLTILDIATHGSRGLEAADELLKKWLEDYGTVF